MIEGSEGYRGESGVPQGWAEQLEIAEQTVGGQVGGGVVENEMGLRSWASGNRERNGDPG